MKTLRSGRKKLEYKYDSTKYKVSRKKIIPKKWKKSLIYSVHKKRREKQIRKLHMYTNDGCHVINHSSSKKNGVNELVEKRIDQYQC